MYKYIFKATLLPLFLAAFIFTPLTTNDAFAAAPVAENGFLDLSSWNFSAMGPVKLDGTWEFYWKQLLSDKDFSGEKPPVKPVIIPVRGLWNNLEVDNNKIPGKGYGTYRLRIRIKKQDTLMALKILDTATAYRLTINGKEIAANGKVSSSPEKAVPQFLPVIAPINLANVCGGESEETADLNLLCQVSNYHHKKGGIWETIYMGSMDQITNMREYSMVVDFFIIGIIFIMGFYHLGLFFLRRRDTSPLFFGLLAILIGARVFVTGERILVHWFPAINFQLLNKLDYITAYCNIALICLFVFVLFRKQFPKLAMMIITIPGFLFAIFILATPLDVYSQLKNIYDLYVVAGGLAILVILGILSFKKVNGAFIALLGFLIMYGTGINDVLYNSGLINTFNMVPFGLFFYIISQSYLLAKLFTNAFIIIENLSEELKTMNVSYSRFVPHQFLSFLGHDSITDVKKGDHVQKEMTVFFSDIRSFTSMSEKMTPQENFKFLNSYLGRVSPLIRNENGFIDKFIGDAIMALFPETVDSALDASINILNELTVYNSQRQNQGYPAVKIGIALHTGVLMLGTIGEENRMDGTVIADAVNLASRLEGLTKIFGSGIIISEETLEKLNNPEKYRCRYLGNVHVKGKDKAVRIYEIFEGDREDVKTKKSESLNDYNNAIDLYYQKNFTESLSSFEKVLDIYPDDIVASFYMKRINGHITKGSATDNETYIRL